MAYMSQERKAELAPAIKAVCAKYGLRASLEVKHHSTLYLNIHAGPIDFIGSYNRTVGGRWHETDNLVEFTPVQDYFQINQYIYERCFDGVALEFLKEVVPLLFIGNHDHSDPQTDYFDVGWYVAINIGRWNKPYILTKEVVADV